MRRGRAISILRTTREYWKSWRNIDDNPLVVYSRPSQRSVIHRFIYFLILLCYLAAIGGLAFSAFNLQQYNESDLERLAMAFFLMPLALPVIALIFVPKWRSFERLQDLHLSMMTRSDLVLGFLYWPLKITARYILITCLIVVVYASLAKGAVNELKDLLSVFGLIVFYALEQILFVLLAVGLWVNSPKPSWATPIRAYFLFAALQLFVFAPTQIFFRRDWEESISLPIFLCVVALIFFGPGIYTLLSNTSQKIMAIVAPQDYLKASWSARDKYTNQSGILKKRKLTMKLFKDHLPIYMMEGLALTICAILVFIRSLSGADITIQTIYPAIGQFGLFSIMIIAVFALLRKFLPERFEYATISGKMLSSLLVHAVPAVLAGVVFVLLLTGKVYIDEQNAPPQRLFSNILGALVIGAMILVGWTLSVVSIIAFLADRKLRIYTSLVILFGFGFLYYKTGGSSQSASYELPSYLLISLVIFVFYVNIMIQFIFNREVKHLPAGTLSTDKDAKPGDIIIPDGTFKI